MRTARDVIDQAIKDNRVPEYLLYTFASIFVVVGTALLIFGFYNKASMNAIAGLILDGLAWPAVRMTREIRQQNMMLRMLEVPLSKAKTADEAAKMLTEAFGNHFKLLPSKNLARRQRAEDELV
jgi:hypothetical protein